MCGPGPTAVYLGTEFLKVSQSFASVLPLGEPAVPQWVDPSGPVERGGCQAEPHPVPVTCNPNWD